MKRHWKERENITNLRLSNTSSGMRKKNQFISSKKIYAIFRFLPSFYVVDQYAAAVNDKEF